MGICLFDKLLQSFLPGGNPERNERSLGDSAVSEISTEWDTTESIYNVQQLQILMIIV